MRIVERLKQPPMQMLLPTAKGQGAQWVRQVWVRTDAVDYLELPHSNRRQAERYASRALPASESRSGLHG